MKAAASLLILTGFLVSCASTQPPNAGRSGDTTMAPRTASNGKSGGGFGGWLKEWYSVENIQKRMAIGAMAGAAASQA